jgi:hypothetical protein
LVTVQRAPQFFFAITLAVPQPFLSPPDAHLPQFAQKAGTVAACVLAGGIVDSYTTAVTASNKLDFFGTLRGRYGYLLRQPCWSMEPGVSLMAAPAPSA